MYSRYLIVLIALFSHFIFANQRVVLHVYDAPMVMLQTMPKEAGYVSNGLQFTVLAFGNYSSWLAFSDDALRDLIFRATDAELEGNHNIYRLNLGILPNQQSQGVLPPRNGLTNSFSSFAVIPTWTVSNGDDIRAVSGRVFRFDLGDDQQNVHFHIGTAGEEGYRTGRIPRAPIYGGDITVTWEFPAAVTLGSQATPTLNRTAAASTGSGIVPSHGTVSQQ